MKKLILFCLLFIITSVSGRVFAQSVYWGNLTFDYDDSLHNQWQVGRPQKKVFDSAFSPLNALVTDTSKPYAPNDTSVFFIGFPRRFRLAPIASWADPFIYNFSFKYRLDIDTTSLATIEFSNDSGKSWISVLDSMAGGSARDTLVYNTKSWQIWYFNMSALSLSHRTDSFVFRFTFVSGNDTMSKDGWMIDDMHVDYTIERTDGMTDKNSLITYPNPAKNELHIFSPDVITSIAITNMVGQVIYSNECNDMSAYLNISGFSPGMYFLNVNNNIIKKFVKQ
jgi:Secretion system C-terminal sorting domain